MANSRRACREILDRVLAKSPGIKGDPKAQLAFIATNKAGEVGAAVLLRTRARDEGRALACRREASRHLTSTTAIATAIATVTSTNIRSTRPLRARCAGSMARATHGSTGVGTRGVETFTGGFVIGTIAPA